MTISLDALIIMTCEQKFHLFAGYAVSCVAGHFVVGPIVAKLWKISEQHFRDNNVKVEDTPIRSHKKLSLWDGIAERALYTTALILKPEMVGVWLAYKAIMRFMVKSEDLRHIPGSSIFRIATILNLGFGLAGALIVKWKGGLTF